MTKNLINQYGPKVVSDYILDFISENKDKPFLVYYPMILTHCPFWPTPDSPEWKDPDGRMPGHYYKGDSIFFSDMVTYMDKMVGRLIAHVDQIGLAEETLIIFTSDNGTDKPIVSRFRNQNYRGLKASTRNGGTHVPLIVRWKGNATPGKVCTDLVDFTDFFPTLLDGAKIPKPNPLILDGHSFLPQIQGKPTNNSRKWVYCWYKRGTKGNAQIFVRDQRYKPYQTGKMYDLVKDSQEKAPLPIDTVFETRKKFEIILKKYQDINTASNTKRNN